MRPVTGHAVGAEIVGVGFWPQATRNLGLHPKLDAAPFSERDRVLFLGEAQAHLVSQHVRRADPAHQPIGTLGRRWLELKHPALRSARSRLHRILARPVNPCCAHS